MIKTTTVWLRKTLKVLLLTALLLVATYASLGRYYIDYIEKYQSLLVGYFVDYTGLPIKVGNLSARWSKLSFILSFKDIELKGGDKLLLSIPRADFKVNPLQSLLDQKVLIDSVSVHGLQTQLNEMALGRWRLAGFEYQADDEAELDIEKLLEFFLAIDRFEFFKSNVALQYHNDDQSSLYFEEIFVRHHDGFRRIHVSADFQDSVNRPGQYSPIDLIVESLGDPRDINFSAKAYAKLEGVDLVDQLPVLHSFGFTPEEVKMDGNVWLEWLPGRVIHAQGHVKTPLLDLAGFSDTDIPPIEELDINFRLEKDLDKEWRMWMPQVKGSWKQQSIDLKNIFVHLDDDLLSVQLPQLNTGSVSQKILKLKMLPEKAQKALSELSPVGDLKNIQLQLPFVEDQGMQYELTGDFSLDAQLASVSLNSWQGTPEFENLDGFVHVNESGGFVMAATEQFKIGFPGVYENPMAFDIVKAKVEWVIEQDRVTVDSGVINLIAEHGPAVAQLALDIPTQGQEPPSMFLAVGLKDTPVSYRNKFIPTLLGADLRAWLDRSVQGGDVNEAGFIYNGSLHEGDELARTVQLFLDVENGSLDYDPGWPALSELSAWVSVDDAQVDVQSPKAIVNDITIEGARVEIKPLASSGSLLTVNAKLSGDAKQGLQVVNQSNLRDVLGDVFSDWQLTGGIKAQLDLSVPLSDTKQKPNVEFTSFLSGGSLYIPSHRVGIDDFYGALNYSTTKGISSEGIEGSALGGKAKVSITQTLNDSVTININGDAAMAEVAKLTQFPGFTYFDGRAQYQSELVVGSNNDRFSLVSDLAGVVIDLPGPLSKTKQEKTILNIEWPLEKNMSILTVSLADKVRSRLRFTNNVLNSGELVFSPETKAPMLDNEFVIRGTLEGVDVDEVQPIIQRYIQRAGVLSAATNTSDKLSAKEPAGEMSLRVDQLTLLDTKAYGVGVEKLVADVQESESGWLLDFSSEKAVGSILFPHEEIKPLLIKFENLSVVTMGDQAPNDLINTEKVVDFYQLQSSIFDNIKIIELSKSNIEIKQLVLDGERLGQLAFELRPEKDRLRVKNITGEIRNLKLSDPDNSLQLTWDKDTETNQSAIKGRIHFDNVGDVLERWDYERAIVSKHGVVDVDLKWPGAPDQWQLALSKGSIKLNIEDGVFVKTASGATGALKIVSVVNLNNILRRLRLDFTDLYKSGVSFDEINGHFELADGRMFIVDHLNIDSPSSRFRVLGSTDLNAEILDMDLIATLPIGENLPWIAALMGGLPAAAIVYAVSKLFESQVDKLSSATYSLEGKWDDPKLTLKKVFDVKGRDRKIITPAESANDDVIHDQEKAQ